MFANPQKPAARAGETRIARWKDDKTAAFCLMFDDSIPSHVATVAPLLRKHDMVGTFYVNPGGWGWQKDRDMWEKELPRSPLFVYANHTMTHKGARSPEQLSDELRQCNDVLYRLAPGKQPRLFSFGRPGVDAKDWTVTDAELAAQLKQHHLVERPPFGGRGAMVDVHTAEQMAKLADGAIAAKGQECVVFHGVGGDWIVTPTPIFERFLELLAGRRDRLWITDHISAHQYEKERESAQAQLLAADAKQIRLRLTTGADPKLYDYPLTLPSRVPARWGTCLVEPKNGRPAKHTPQGGTLRFDAAPGAAEITIRPLKAV